MTVTMEMFYLFYFVEPYQIVFYVSFLSVGAWRSTAFNRGSYTFKRLFLKQIYAVTEEGSR